MNHSLYIYIYIMRVNRIITRKQMNAGRVGSGFVRSIIIIYIKTESSSMFFNQFNFYFTERQKVKRAKR